MFDPESSPQALFGVPIERGLLKDQAVERMREAIIGGRIPLGTKLVEREVAAMLGISRMPVHEAFIALEKEGLVVTRTDARYVIELTEIDIVQLYQVRLVLERLAVELAAKNTCPTNQRALTDLLQTMRKSVAERDRSLYTRTDVDTHREIWRQSANRHLITTLNTMIGPVFMFVAANVEAYDWAETIEPHEELVAFVNAGDVQGAALSMERHLQSALNHSLGVFAHPAPTTEVRHER